MSEDNFLLSDTIKSKKIILNESDLSEDLSSLHIVASTNTGGAVGASDQDISSLSAVTTSISQDLNEDISSLIKEDQEFHEDLNLISQDINSANQAISSNTDSIDSLNEDVSSLMAVNQGLENALNQQLSSLSLVEASTNSLTEEISSLKAADQNIQDSLDEDISSLSSKQLGSIEQVLIDYSLSQDSAITAEYRLNESSNGLTNISDSLSNSADAILSDPYSHTPYTFYGIDISTEQNNSLTLPSLQSNLDQFISFPLWTESGYGYGTFNNPLLMTAGWSFNYDKVTSFGMEMNIQDPGGTTTLKVRANHGNALYTNSNGAFTLVIENHTGGSFYQYGEHNMQAEMRTTIRIDAGVTTVGEFIQDISSRTNGNVEISITSGSEDALISNFIGTHSSNYDAFRDDFVTRSIQGNGQSIFLQKDLSIITVKQTGEVIVLNNGLSNSITLGNLDFSNSTSIFWPSQETMSIPYIITGTDYSLIDKVEWYLANELNALDSLPSSHNYKNTAPEGSISEQLVSTDAFFSSFYQDYLQLKETVSSLSAS